MYATILLLAVTVVAGGSGAGPRMRNLLYERPVDFGDVLSGRAVYDGSCGLENNCTLGYCCSRQGYCGITQDYCGPGCQAQYGICGAENRATFSDEGPTASAHVSVVVASSTTDVTENLASVSYKSQRVSTPPSVPPGSTATRTGYTDSSSYTVPVQPTSGAPGPAASSVAYKLYTGNGAASGGWPDMNSWASFDSLWEANLPTLRTSCTQFAADNNSDEENMQIRSAIMKAAISSGVDERFILAIMMQESKGCTRVPGTNGGVPNPGLMQSHNGTGFCGATTQGGENARNPCPSSEITQMINDGVHGTLYKGPINGGDGLQQLVTGNDARAYYEAARKYNSGSIAPSGDLGQGGATHCYCSDIANRLLGWTTSATKCHIS